MWAPETVKEASRPVGIVRDLPKNPKPDLDRVKSIINEQFRDIGVLRRPGQEDLDEMLNESMSQLSGLVDQVPENASTESNVYLGVPIGGSDPDKK